MSRLVMRRGPEPGAIFELSAEVVKIGRGAKNDIVINDNEVGREHCRLERFMGEYELHDLGTNTGTFVNGQRVIGKWALQADCIIELGEQITFFYEHDPNSASVLKPISREELAQATHLTVNPSLVLMTSNLNQRVVYTLSDNEIIVGRDLGSGIVIQEPEVSRSHMRLRRAGNTYMLEDLGSTNGTYVNSKAVTKGDVITLQNNDVIEIGMMVHMVFTWDTDLPKDIEKRLTPPPKLADLPKTNKLTTDAVKTLGPARKSDEFPTVGPVLKPGDLKGYIIVAYARQHWETVVAPLVRTLRGAGLNVWADQHLTRGSDQWDQDSQQAQKEGFLLVVVVSPESLESRFVIPYYRQFFTQRKPIVPLVYAPVPAMPAELAKPRAVQYDPQNPQRAFQRIIFEIMHHKR